LTTPIDKEGNFSLILKVFATLSLCRIEQQRFNKLAGFNSWSDNLANNTVRSYTEVIGMPTTAHILMPDGTSINSKSYE